MKTSHSIAITLFIFATLGCSKQESSPSTEKPMDTMPTGAEVNATQMLPNEIKADDTTTAIEQNDSGKKVLYWYDPMMEGRHFSKSGQSPFMDMKLAPQYAVDADKGGKP